jgi:uncharacterized protein YecT (DUF1311 family)
MLITALTAPCIVVCSSNGRGIFDMEIRKSLARTFSMLLSISSCACSATSPNDAHIPAESETRANTTSAYSCESGSQACNRMESAAIEMRAIENEIVKMSAVAYGNYLADDPEYVKDIEDYLSKSDKAWASYRDAQCQLEPYINGMSRREISNIAEQCKLERTEHRISELKGLLTTVKSNLE